MATSMTGNHRRDLRRKAEALAASNAGRKKFSLDQDTQDLIHEIQVNQIELEIQNSELVESRKELIDSKSKFETLYNKYANLFELAPNAYIVFDQTGCICDANLPAAIMLDTRKSKLIGVPIVKLVHCNDQDPFHLLVQRCCNSPGPVTAMIHMGAPGRRTRPVQFQLQRLPRINKPGVEYRAAVLDMSEQLRISHELEMLHQCLENASEAKNPTELAKAYVENIKKFSNCSAVGIRFAGETGSFPFAAAEGFSREFLQKEMQLSLGGDQGLCANVVNGRLAPDTVYSTSFGSFYSNNIRELISEGSSADLSISCSLCSVFGYKSVALIPIAHDSKIVGLIHVADRRSHMIPRRFVEILEQEAGRLGSTLRRLEIQEQLRESIDNLRDLSSHLLKAKEEEQRRIAMELHDQTGQDLNVLKLKLKEIGEGLQTDQNEVQALCRSAETFVDHIIGDIRRMTHGLNPETFEILGLIAAINQMARELEKHGSMQIETHLTPLGKVGHRETQLGLYRIVQEALNNVHKHAAASKVIIHATETRSGLRVVIEDNGKGINSDNPNQSPGHDKGMGLQAMDLRARMIGAKLAIMNRPGQGVRITVDLPMGEGDEPQ